MPGRYLDEKTKFYRAQVGELIWCWRQERGLTQIQLAAACGMEFSRISFLENGTRPAKSYDLMVIAKALGVGVSDLTPKEQVSKQ